ncbi:MAG: PleD family two-component system response regulator [Caulobacterales bacterium]
MTARILIVDDYEPNLKLLEARLSYEYFQVYKARDGRSAIECAVALDPDVILLDVMMPGLDGYQTCEILKANPKTSHIPVVMVTALDGQEDRVRGLEAGADDFLTKPIDELPLLARVRSLARLKGAIDDLRSREASSRRLGLIEDRERSFSPTGGRILVLEDNAEQAERLSSILSDEQHVSLWRSNMDLTGAFNSGIDLLVVSLLSPQFDGLRIISSVRANAALRSLPVLALTNPEDRARSLQAINLGASDIIAAPAESQELRARVRSQVRRKRYLDAMKQALDQGLELAVIDQLTGLYNRRYMMSQLRPLFARASAGAEDLSALLIDLDHFKQVNDTYGHDVGDDALREIAKRITACFRPLDIVCRFGGEEFFVVMPGTKRADAAAIAERLRRHVALTPVRIREGLDALNLTLSIGVASVAGHGDSVEALIKRADEAVYAAKSAGRNRVIDQKEALAA